MSRLYISTSFNDLSASDALVSALQHFGHSCWHPYGKEVSGNEFFREPDEDHGMATTRAIRNCDAVIFFLSKISITLPSSKEEVLAAALYRKPVLTVRLDDMELDWNYTAYLQNFPMIDAVGDFPSQLPRVVHEISNALSAFPSSVAVPTAAAIVEQPQTPPRESAYPPQRAQVISSRPNPPSPPPVAASLKSSPGDGGFVAKSARTFWAGLIFRLKVYGVIVVILLVVILLMALVKGCQQSIGSSSSSTSPAMSVSPLETRICVRGS